MQERKPTPTRERASALDKLVVPGSGTSNKPISRPPKSPKRYNSTSSTSSPRPPSLKLAQFTRSESASSSQAGSSINSNATSPTSPGASESYFDALSIPAASSPIDISHNSLPVPQKPPPLLSNNDRRPSTASSGCLSDEDVATRTYAQRRFERRTSALPLPSPDAPHSQRRRRHRHRSPSNASGVSSSQTSISSTAGSVYGGDSDGASISESLYRSASPAPLAGPSTSAVLTSPSKERGGLSPRLRDLQFDGQSDSLPTTSGSPIQRSRLTIRHPHAGARPDRQPSSPTSRTSQTTSPPIFLDTFGRNQSRDPHDNESYAHDQHLQSESGSPLQRSRLTIRHSDSSAHRNSHASESTSNGSRVRTSQATSYGPFDLDGRSTNDEYERDQQSERLQFDFFDSLEQGGRPRTRDSSYASHHLSVPSSARSLDTFAFGQPASSFSQYAPGYSPSLSDESTHRRLDSADSAYLSAMRGASQSRSIPVVTQAPVASLSTSPGGRSHLSVSPGTSHTADYLDSISIHPDTTPKHDASSFSPKFRRESASTTTTKRVGRIYSTSSDMTALEDLKTPRVSVSTQGRMADSVYSTAGTAPDSYPSSPPPDTYKDLPAFPEDDESEAVPPDRRPSLGLGFPLTAAAYIRAGHRPSLTLDDTIHDRLFEEPPTSRFSIYTDSLVSSNGSPTGFGTDSGSLPPTPGDSFRNSVNSLASSLNLTPMTPSAGTDANLSEEEKRNIRRGRLVQELIQTEVDFARDMSLVRDVWLARARGKEMGDISATLEQYESSSTRPLSISSSNLTGGRSSIATNDSSFPLDHFKIPARKVSAPQMQRNSSQNSVKSLTGFLSNVKQTSSSVNLPKARQASGKSASSGGFTNAPSGSTAHLPPGAALYAPIRQGDTDVIFGNVEEVATFSADFAELLQRAMDETERSRYGEDAGIGKIFNGVLPRLSKVFSTYCSKFGDAMQRWEALSSSLASYTADCKDLCYGHTNAWDLPSLLIKPVQRCLKYPLFIQSLLECTPDDHPDKQQLQVSNIAMLKVAESINEMKRRHDIVARLIRRKTKPGLYGSSRRISNKAVPTLSPKETSGGFSASLAKKFRRQSRIKASDAAPALVVPETDQDFDALLVKFEAKYRNLQAFIVESKAWSKSVRATMVNSLQVSLAWKSVSNLGGLDSSSDALRSSRTIDHFAVGFVRHSIEDQWRSLDQDIRKAIVPRVHQLLDLFSGPRNTIAARYHRQSESQSKVAAKDYAVFQEHALAYHALNDQLKEELPVFLAGVDKFFAAVLQRFVALQVAFNERMAESWLAYVQACCSQLGPSDQATSENVKEWWTLHKPLAQRFDALHILDTDRTIQEVERRQRDSLPSNLRPRSVSDKLSASTPPPSASAPMSLRRSRHASSDYFIDSTTTSSINAPISRRSVEHQQMQADPINRNSAFSSTSAGSMTFSGRSVSSVTSPPTPSPGYHVLWQAAVATSFRPSGYKPPQKGFPYLSCEAGDLFDVLDALPGEKHLLVRHEGLSGEIGWLPAHLLHRLD